MWTTLLILAMGPGIAIVLYIYWRDRNDRETFRHLGISFLLGILSAALSIVTDIFIEPFQAYYAVPNSIHDKLFKAYIMAAFVEETWKFIMCRWYAYPKKEFNEPLDGIVYMVMVSMGFATIENVLYVFRDTSNGLSTGILRMFLAVPGHACWGIITGYFLGLAKFKSRVTGTMYVLAGLSIAIFLHGTYDAALFLQETTTLQQYNGILAGGALATVVLSYTLAFLAIRKHRKISKLLFPK